MAGGRAGRLRYPAGGLPAGYESLSLWPEQYAGQIDTLRAGRMLWVSNYVALNEREYLADFVERVAERFEFFLASGQIRK